MPAPGDESKTGAVGRPANGAGRARQTHQLMQRAILAGNPNSPCVHTPAGGQNRAVGGIVDTPCFQPATDLSGRRIGMWSYRDKLTPRILHLHREQPVWAGGEPSEVFASRKDPPRLATACWIS